MYRVARICSKHATRDAVDSCWFYRIYTLQSSKRLLTFHRKRIQLDFRRPHSSQYIDCHAVYLLNRAPTRDAAYSLREFISRTRGLVPPSRALSLSFPISFWFSPSFCDTLSLPLGIYQALPCNEWTLEEGFKKTSSRSVARQAL